MEKEYYLETYRTTITGITLLFMGIIMGPGLMGKAYFRLFISFPGIITGLISLAFIIGGIYILKMAKKIIRAKIDEKGFYYKNLNIDTNKIETFVSYGLKSLIHSTNAKLTFVPFYEIKKAELKKNNWTGNSITIHYKNQTVENLHSLNVLTNTEKLDIVSAINNSI